MKNIFTTILFIIITSVQAQVIIGNATGTAAVKTSVLLEFAKENKGLIVPYVRAKPATPAEGTILLDATNSSTARMKFFNGAWQDLSGHDADISTALSIQPTIVEVPEASTAKTIIGAQASSADGALVLESTTKAMVLPTVEDVKDIPSPSPGMMVYVNKAGGKRLAVYNGSKWSFWKVGNPTTNGTGIVSSYTCNTASTGTLTVGEAVSGVTQTITATITTPGRYNIIATANGITFSGSGVFASAGTQNLVLTATGTPIAAGTSNFVLNTTPGCNFNRVIVAPQIMPLDISLYPLDHNFVVSVYDQDYSPYVNPTLPATLDKNKAADGINEGPLINIQGKITTTGIPIYIKYKSYELEGILPAYSQRITIPAIYTEDNTARDLIFSWPETAYTTSTSPFNDSLPLTITATLKAVDNDLLVKKLDVQTGVGNDQLGILIGSFDYPYNNGGDTYKFDVRATSGLPDRMFGIPDNTGDNTKHKFIYLPIKSLSGKIWLNKNLGAEYARVDSPDFNANKIIATSDDHNAYGSLFQWGRKPDGHELVNWTSNTTGLVGPKTTIKSNSPTTNEFIISGSGSRDWRVTNDDTLWNSVNSANNPCPSGYRLPTEAEFRVEIAPYLYNSTAYRLLKASTLNLPTPGVREEYNGEFNTDVGIGFYGVYWTSSIKDANYNYPNQGMNLYFNTTPLSIGGIDYSSRAKGHTVRCIKD